MSGPIKFDFTYFRGRVAMAAALKALGVGPGAHVALQAYTCIAVPEAILAVGAIPLYIDVEKGGVTMDAESLAARITADTRAVIVQHTFGLPADMRAIMQVADAHKLPVIEDCAHTYWSEFEGQRCGTFGVAASYSLEWGKPLVLGVGGGLVVNNDALRPALEAHHRTLATPSTKRDLRMQLQYAAFQATYSPRRYWQIKALYNRLSRAGVAEQSFNAVQGEIAPDFGMKLSPSVARRMQQKMPAFAADWERQRLLVSAYEESLLGVGGFARIMGPPKARAMYGRLPLCVADKAGALQSAKNIGFEVSDWFDTAIDPLPPEDYSSVHYTAGSCRNAELAASHVVSLPVNSKVSRASAEVAARRMAEHLSVQRQQTRRAFG